VGISISHSSIGKRGWTRWRRREPLGYPETTLGQITMVLGKMATLGYPETALGKMATTL
jgi:hypothetical protein